MGCGASKVDELPLVMLCKERRDLIKNAADLRHLFASSHASYFLALESTGNALDQFLVEEITAISAPSNSSFTPSSPVLTIPSSQGKQSKSKSKSESKSISADTSSSPSSLTHSLSLEDSNHRIASESDPEEKFRKEASFTSSPSYHYSMWQSSTNPTTVYENPYPEYGNLPGYGVQDRMNSYYFGDPSSSYYNGAPAAPATPPQPPPTPPAPEYSPWDFFNPFHISPEDYSSRRYGSVASSPNSSTVREREGIPELEEETESEAMGGSKRDKRPRAAKAKKKVPGKNAARVERESSTSSAGNNVRGSAGVRTLDGSSSQEKESAEDVEKKKEVSFEDETSAPTETGVSAKATKSVTEVAQEIKEQFRLASSLGIDVSSVLDVGAPKYQPRSAINGVIFSRISDALSCSSCKWLENSTADSLRFAKTWYDGTQDRMSGRGGHLSSTLDMLAMWETELYKEVRKEEELRAQYKDKLKRLKYLVERGEEPHKLEAVQASITKLLAKLDISLKTIEAISKRIHRLRDLELLPLISELVRRCIVMWKSLLDCHQKQFTAVTQCKSSNLTAKTTVPRGGRANTTRDLEVEILNWLCCFCDWINTQKHCFTIMNEWLRRCIYVDFEEAPDGMPPYSPGRSGAPPVFVIFNDLAEAMRTLSERHVATAMEACAEKVRSLWLTQDAAQRRRQRADQLSKDLATRLRSRRGAAFSSELMEKILEQEKFKNREEFKQVRDVAQSSLREGLVPVFNELGNFAEEILRAYEGVRLTPLERRR